MGEYRVGRRDLVVALGEPRVFWGAIVALALAGAVSRLVERWWWATLALTAVVVAVVYLVVAVRTRARAAAATDANG